MNGVLTAIQRFSLHDGPGIRTTVFFKGCNMRCRWCHNPETFSLRPEVLWSKDKCVGCGACAAVCGCHAPVDGVMRFDRTSCTNCGNCADVCFSGALELCGKEYSVEDILKEVIQDKEYYEQSGGGVTLSGGEVLMQSAFAAKLLKALKEYGIATAIESNMSTDHSRIEALIPYLDLVMCDLKLSDTIEHEKWTGIGNAQIRENIEKVSAVGVPVILRTPVIPGVNDRAEEIGAIASFAGTLPSLVYYELLNFNPLGGSKYERLSMDNEFSEARPLSEDVMAALAAEAGRYCAQVRIG